MDRGLERIRRGLGLGQQVLSIYTKQSHIVLESSFIPGLECFNKTGTSRAEQEMQLDDFVSFSGFCLSRLSLVFKVMNI